MLPPNTYTHAILKRVEALRSNPPTTSANAPSPYTTPPSLPSTFSIPASVFLDDPDEDLENDDDDEVDASSPRAASPPAPIIIKIDAGLTVEGDGNTILLPSTGYGTAGGPSTIPSATIPTATAAFSTRPTLLPTPTPTPTATMFTTTDPAPYAQTPQGQDTLAHSLLSVLRTANLIPGAASPSPPASDTLTRPIEISINAGIRILGSRNLVTRGNALKIVGKPNGDDATAMIKSDGVEGKNAGGSARAMPREGSKDPGSRKRRAESEPLEAAMTPKKPHVC